PGKRDFASLFLWVRDGYERGCDEFGLDRGRGSDYDLGDGYAGVEHRRGDEGRDRKDDVDEPRTADRGGGEGGYTAGRRGARHCAPRWRGECGSEFRLLGKLCQ